MVPKRDSGSTTDMYSHQLSGFQLSNNAFYKNDVIRHSNVLPSYNFRKLEVHKMFSFSVYHEAIPLFGIKIRYVATIMEKINGQTPKNGVVFDTTSNVQPI